MGENISKIEKGVFILPEALSIENASDLKSGLLSYLDEIGDSPIINLSGLEDADMPIIQVLIALVRECNIKGTKLSFQGPLKEDLLVKLQFADYISVENDCSLFFSKIVGGGVQIDC